MPEYAKIAVWYVVCVVLAVLLSLRMPGLWERFVLPPSVLLWVSVIGLDIICAYLIYHHAKSHGRSAVVWATAFLVFSPLLAGIAYLFSRAKNRH